jgi:hypothetical protein
MTITLDPTTVATAVRAAIDDLQTDFQPEEFVIEPDGQGGARVRFGPVDLGDVYTQRQTWVGGHIPSQIPYADVYPIFVRGDLARTDGKPFVAPMSNGHNFMGQPAVQVSRKSNRRDAAIETVKMKFKKVLAWMNAQ